MTTFQMFHLLKLTGQYVYHKTKVITLEWTQVITLSDIGAIQIIRDILGGGGRQYVTQTFFAS